MKFYSKAIRNWGSRLRSYETLKKVVLGFLHFSIGFFSRTETGDELLNAELDFL